MPKCLSRKAGRTGGPRSNRAIGIGTVGQARDHAGASTRGQGHDLGGSCSGGTHTARSRVSCSAADRVYICAAHHLPIMCGSQPFAPSSCAMVRSDSGTPYGAPACPVAAAPQQTTSSVSNTNDTYYRAWSDPLYPLPPNAKKEAGTVERSRHEVTPLLSRHTARAHTSGQLVAKHAHQEAESLGTGPCVEPLRASHCL